MAGTDGITFNMPTTEPGYSAAPLSYTIQPSSSLPAVTGAVTIDGTTQPDFPGTPIIQLDGSLTASDGILLNGGASTIRGLVIFGFFDDAIQIGGSGGDLIVGNYIGIDVSETAQPNGDDAVDINADNITVGGLAPGDANVLSGNARQGIEIAVGVTGTVIIGNYIGTDAAGTSPIPNARSGILIRADVANTVIGGPGLGAGNVIAFNGNQGVRMFTGTGTDNQILGNSIHSNGLLGIDLNDDGVTANDLGDGDTGVNNLLNFPVITSAVESGGSVTITFDLDTPGGNYRVEFFTNPSGADPSGNGEGETYESATTVSPGTGLTHSFPGSAGDIITTTATEDLGGSYGSTSEFSGAVTAVASGFTVNSTGDATDTTPGDGVCDTGGLNSESNPECTLRASIEEANALAGADNINFNIPTTESGYGATPLRYTIRTGSALPAITEAVTINGTSQPDYPGTPIIDLYGIDVSSGESGLEITSGNSTVRGLVIRSFPSHGLVFRTGGSNVVEDNYIGTDVTGLLDFGNAGEGIFIQDGSSDNTIGGVGVGNLISGNGGNGIDIDGGTTTGTVIQGNYIGTTAAGTSALGNDSEGINIRNGATGTTVGGAGAGEGNVISGNNQAGVRIQTNGNTIEGNFIGTDPTGTIDVGNQDDGVRFLNTASNNVLGGPGAGNVIAYNTKFGVDVELGTANAILNNTIFANSDLGINLTGGIEDGFSVTANDIGDLDAGPNDLLNYPVITSGWPAGGRRWPPSMADKRTTGNKAASAAGKVLSNPKSTNAEKSAAASALSQTKSKKRGH